MSAWLWRPSRRTGIFLSIILLFTGYVSVVEPNWLEVTHHEAWFKTLPREFDGLVVAHVSDLHMVNYGLREKRVVARLAEAKPGLIVLTGDLIKGRNDHASLQQFLKDLGQLHTTFGVWAVLGNHEHTDVLADGIEGMRKFFLDADVALLVNESGRIGRGLDTMSLIGVDDAYTGRDRLTEAMQGVRRTPFAVLLTHSPEIFVKADMAHFDLVLAGHTHGGQVRVPGFGPLYLPEGSEAYDAGWFAGQSARMYVTRGVGTSIVPIRLLCRPEITFITLRRDAR